MFLRVQFVYSPLSPFLFPPSFFFSYRDDLRRGGNACKRVLRVLSFFFFFFLPPLLPPFFFLERDEVVRAGSSTSPTTRLALARTSPFSSFFFFLFLSPRKGRNRRGDYAMAIHDAPHLFLPPPFSGQKNSQDQRQIHWDAAGVARYRCSPLFFPLFFLPGSEKGESAVRLRD